MRPADTWKDYELLDATDGNRLERWGETILIRPDPQVVWKTEKQSPLWAKADAIYHRSNQGGGEWEYRRRLPEKWKISCGEGEDKLTLIVSPTGFKHTGVFPEQAVNWAWYQQKIRAAGRPVKVLNLFGYTGGATLACAAAGATVCHVDASKGIVAWGKDNAAASGLDGVVCSPLEAGKVHERCGQHFLTVTPGVRFADGDVGDQKRVMTPAAAKAIGSDYIVVGRPITAAADPVAAYERCVAEFCD